MRPTFALMLVITALLAYETSKAQDTSLAKKPWEVTGGLMLAPQGGINLTHTEEGSFTTIQVFLVAPVTHAKWTFTPFYNMGNGAGLATELSLSANHGIYVVGSKYTLLPGGYVGLGTDTPVHDGLAFFFVEFGTVVDTEMNDQYIFSGVFIPLTKKSLSLWARPKAR